MHFGSSRPFRDLSSMRRGAMPVLWVGLVTVLLMLWIAVSAHAGPTVATESSLPTASAPAAASAPAMSSEASLPRIANYYRLWVLAPAMVAIVLAVALRQVVPALTVGILVGGYMTAPFDAQVPAGGPLVAGLRMCVERYLIGALADDGHIRVILFTLMIGGMVGIIAANGGTAAIVQGVSRWASSPRRGQLSTWFAGLIVFFDDYANAMIVGPAMRPVTDRLKISRAKLSYIIDSTAAPVSSIALIGTWVGTEISYVRAGLDKLTPLPAFLEGTTAYDAFLYSIPYRFYPWLAMFFVAMVGLLGRDFGPMLRAERRSAAGIDDDALAASGAGDAAPRVGSVWQALIPVGVMVVVTAVLLGVSGWVAVADQAEQPTGFKLVQEVISNSNSYDALLYGSLAGVVSAVVISVLGRALTLSQCVDAAQDTMARMLPTIVVLVLAWTLAGSMNDLSVGKVAGFYLSRAEFPVQWLPLLVFLSSCVVSFATGSSWSTMAILCPIAVTLAAGLLDADTQVSSEMVLPIFYATVGAVLSGSVFGDHCSPISDTTVISSIASECSLEAHVWTQMPYALTVAAVSILTGDVLCRAFEQPWWVGMAAGSLLLCVVLLVMGRKPGAASAPEAG